MPYSVEKNPNLKISKKAMSCDDNIVENLSPPLSPVSHMYLFCGAPGSGKTTAMLNLISKRKKYNGFKTSYYKAYEHVFLCSPSLHTIKDSPFKDHPEEKVYTEFDDQFLDDIEAFCSLAADECQNTLIILDDVGSMLKNAGLERRFSYLCQRRRHLHLSIWLLMQRYTQVPKNIRASCITHLFLFRPQNMKELQQVHEELLPIKKEEVLGFLKYIWNVKYGFLFVDMSLANSNTFEFYRNFDRISFN
ncbi:MAG: ATPase/DNA packaging protein [Paracoccaceae bacterium]